MTPDRAPDLFDYAAAKAARDEGIAQVAANNVEFKTRFLNVILRLPPGWRGTCEDIRREWTGELPGHPNAWGACWNAAKRQGLVVELDVYVPTIARKSHARKTPLYERPGRGQ